MGRADAVLHLHRFQHHQLRPGFDRLPGLHQHPHDAAVHGRSQPALMTVAGLDGTDRVVGLDAMQLTVPLQIHMFTPTDRPMLAAHAVVFGQQLLAPELGVDVAQSQRTILAFTTQVQGDFRWQSGAESVADGPGRTRIFTAC
ncbi:hypothetical protein D3C86_1588720 [compost metagenome]